MTVHEVQESAALLTESHLKRVISVFWNLSSIFTYFEVEVIRRYKMFYNLCETSVFWFLKKGCYPVILVEIMMLSNIWKNSPSLAKRRPQLQQKNTLRLPADATYCTDSNTFLTTCHFNPQKCGYRAHLSYPLSHVVEFDLSASH